MKRLLIVACLFAAGCSSPSTTQRVLTEQGYTDIKTTGYDWFACGKDDTFATGFIATNPIGTVVTGTVCSGWMKGYTIRFK